MTWHAGGAQGEVWEFGGPAFGGPYDWGNMVAEPRPAAQAGELTEVQRQAIGLLCRDCGISVDMNYRLGGSGSSTAKIGPQLVRQFGYRNAAVRSNGNDISLSEQMDAYLPSFALGSPCAVGIPGHAILTDGFGYSADGRPYVHYNYGWGASYWYTPPDAEESDTEYPIVKTIVYNIWTPDVDIAPETSIVSGFVVAEDGVTPVAGAEVAARDGVTGAEVSAETDASGFHKIRRVFLIYPADGHQRNMGKRTAYRLDIARADAADRENLDGVRACFPGGQDLGRTESSGEESHTERFAHPDDFRLRRGCDQIVPAGIIGHGDLFGTDDGPGAYEKPVPELLFHCLDGVRGIFPGFGSTLVVGHLHQSDSALFKGVTEPDHILRREPADNRDDLPLLNVLQWCHFSASFSE